ncbi:MAG: hypothetical protein AAF703_08690 [Cyanobacteria bacterium P01_D01_bin.105]
MKKGYWIKEGMSRENLSQENLSREILSQENLSPESVTNAKGTLSSVALDTHLQAQNHRKRRYALALLVINIIAISVLTVFHYQDINALWPDRFFPPFLVAVDSVLFIYLYKKPASLKPVLLWSILTPIVSMTVATWSHCLIALHNPELSLVNSFPPFLSPVLVLPMLMAFVLRRKQLLTILTVFWLSVLIPILTYFLHYPAEITSPRGIDMVLALGPSMGGQIALTLFYVRLQEQNEQLYLERLSDYSKIIERQRVRQDALEQAFGQIHNGPLQTLAVLLRDIQHQPIHQPLPAEKLWERLSGLNTEIREVRTSLIDDGLRAVHNIDTAITSPRECLSEWPLEHLLRMGEGSYLDLNLPLHCLFRDVYTFTLKRPLPYFAGIKVKVREFSPIDNVVLSLGTKRSLCLWLEEALCNVGKHARGATRIIVMGRNQAGIYRLSIQDNGRGISKVLEQRKLDQERQRQGTQQSHELATQLGGKFHRESLPKGGVICELSWPIDLA